MKRRTITDWLIENGLCADKQKATALLLTGKVLINNVPARSNSLVRSADEVRIKGQALPYASKGGLKLAGALSRFGLSPRGKTCLDAGASTGGFTDCLLKQGATLVYAVDVGYGQLTGALRQNPRVINLERTNLSDSSLLSLSPRPEFATCDLSYLSLREAVPVYRRILKGEGELVALVKPLFEISDPEARRTGQIAEEAYGPLLEDLITTFNRQDDTRVMGVCASPVTGNAGTVEFFLHILFGGDGAPKDLAAAITSSVQEALHTDIYKKAGDLTLGSARLQMG